MVKRIKKEDKMAIIYTYPVKATPNTNDLILISDSEDSNKTKQVTIGSLPGGTAYTAGDGLDLTGTTFSTDLKANGGLVIESTELAVDLGASSITGTLALGDGGTGLTTVVNNGIVFANNNSTSFASSSQLVYDQGILIVNGTTTTGPGSQISSANATSAIANSGTWTGAQGALSVYSSSTNSDITALAIGSESMLQPSISRLITFYAPSHLGPGLIRCGDILADRSSLNVSFANASDYRLKESVLQLTNCTDKIKNLKPIKYNIIGQDKLIEGFLAHELQEYFPNAVVGEKDAVDNDGSINPQMVDYTKVIPALVGAIKELTARIEALEA